MKSVLANPINAIIVLAWAVFLLYWGTSAIGTKQTIRKRNWVAVILMLIAVVGLFLLLQFSLIPNNINYLLWQNMLPLSIFALIIVLIGLFVLIWARKTLGSNWNANVETNEWQAMVQKGPYAKIRHPMYSGFLSMILGSALAYGRLLGVAVAVAFAVGFYIKALQEEMILIKKYGRAYQDYKAKTKAFLPYIV